LKVSDITHYICRRRCGRVRELRASGSRAGTPALQLAAKYSHLRGLTRHYDADQSRGHCEEKGTVPF
ncbi:unnamed protein product, partial [Arctogadus glacialis]